MTDVDAIALLEDLIAESEDEESALAGSREDFTAAKAALRDVFSSVPDELAKVERRVRYAHNLFLGS